MISDVTNFQGEVIGQAALDAQVSIDDVGVAEVGVHAHNTARGCIETGSISTLRDRGRKNLTSVEAGAGAYFGVPVQLGWRETGGPELNCAAGGAGIACQSQTVGFDNGPGWDCRDTGGIGVLEVKFPQERVKDEG